MSTTFYGACSTCKQGYWAEVAAGPGPQMLGSSVTVVCQEHFPVGEADCVSEHMMRREDVRKWAKWRKWAEREVASSSE